jgi:hypothetical protein
MLGFGSSLSPSVAQDVQMQGFRPRNTTAPQERMTTTFLADREATLQMDFSSSR